MINIFPEFESRQVLTADELNWMACYLDTQERQARRYLTGCGLIGGLQVKLVNNSVQVTPGIGVTSAGHTVSLAGSGTITFTRQKAYTQQANEKLAYPYLSDQDPLAENYAQSVDQPSLYFQDFGGPVLELFEDTVNDTDPIDGAAFSGKVVMLFAEIIQKELKDCEGDNCQERGKKYIFKTKVLVIHREDALLLLSKEYNSFLSEDAVSRLAFPWLHLPNLNILKPVFSGKSVNTSFAESVLVNDYLRCIRDFLTVLSANKAALEQALSHLYSYCSVTPGHVAMTDQLITATSQVINTAGLSPALAEMVYDHLWCFVKAYHELQADAQQLRAKCFTREAAFPNHLFLGLLDTANEDFGSPVSTAHSVYRHYFQSRLVQTRQAEVARNVVTGIKRLTALAGAFDPAVLTKKEIRVTPGGDLYGPLSAQAIPAYLSVQAAQWWNAQALHPHLNRYTTGYSYTNDNQAASAGLAYNTLPYALQGNHAFFRIEGIYGQPAINALNTLFQLRKKHGMAFEVLLLRLNEKAPFSHSFNFTINEDVESMYQVVRAEVLKQISLNLGFLRGIQLKSGKFNGIRDVLQEQLEKSYMRFLVDINSLLKVKKLTLELSEAIIASNITTNYKAKAFTIEDRYSELETITAQAKPSTRTLVQKESITMAKLKFPAVTPVLQPGLISVGVFFFNTVGSLMDTLRRHDKFKNTTDISFYSHLLKVARGIQKDEPEMQLFLYVLQLCCALKLQEEYLSENFLELDIQKYRDNLEDELIPASVQLMNHLRSLSATAIGSDEILSQVNGGDLRDCAARVRYDDDWIKIMQLDAENKRRNGGLGVENLLEEFVRLHPGVAHGCGVPRGGTYLMIYDAASQVVADLYLPYIIASHLRPIQFTLLENKTVTVSGTVKNAAGDPMEGVTVWAGDATVLTGKDGFYTVLVSENSTVKITCKAAGFEDFSIDVTVSGQSKEQHVVMKPLQVVTFKTSVQFYNQRKQAVTRNFSLLEAGKEVAVKKGVLTLTAEPGKTFRFVVKDESFMPDEFEITTVNKDQALDLPLIELDFFQIQLSSAPRYVPSLLGGIRVIDPEMELDMSKAAEGFFVTKTREDIDRQPTALVIYNQKTVRQAITAGQEVNKILVDSAERIKEKSLVLTAGILYAEGGGLLRAGLRSLTVNGTVVPLDLQTHTGKAMMGTGGELDISKHFPAVKPLTIDSFKEVQAVSLLIDSAFIAANERVTNDRLFTFSKTVTAAEKKSLIARLPKLRPMAVLVTEDIPAFYCMLISPDDFEVVSKTLKL